MKRQSKFWQGAAAIAIVAGLALLSPVLAKALTLSQITPSSGSTAGGNIITITGSGFEPDIPTMQNFGADKCASMTVYDGSNIGALLTLKDTRNDQIYTVGKLADGNCWMLDNLKIADVAVDNTDTDLNTITGFTIPALVTSVPSDYDNPFTYGPIAGDTGTGATNYGYLYNWSAATAGESQSTMPAGSGNAQNSVCPRGWHLPTGGAGGEYVNLDIAFGGSGSTVTGGPSFDSWVFTGPFRGVSAGDWYNGDFHDEDFALLWTSTAGVANSQGANAGGLNFMSRELRPDATYHRDVGFSIRCLAGAATTDTNIHYDPKPTVTVDGVIIDPSNVELVSDSELRVRMPAHLSGMVNVVITLGAETRTVQYEYVDLPVPVVPGAPNTGFRQNTTSY